MIHPFLTTCGGCVKPTKILFYQKDAKINVTNAIKNFNSLHLNTEAPKALLLILGPEAKHQKCTIVSHVVFHGGWPLQPQDIILSCFLFVCNRRDTIQYYGGLRSRELGQAPMLQVFLTPRQALSSHTLKQMV
jgi:hypothetical protein